MTGQYQPVPVHRADTAPVRIPALAKEPVLRGWALLGLLLIGVNVALVTLVVTL